MLCAEDDALRAARLGLRGKEDKASERGLLWRSQAARTVLARLVQDAGEEVSPAKLRDQYARLVEAPAELAAASSNRRAQIEAGKLSAQHLVLAEAACECADAAARALPRLFEDLCRAALDATGEDRRRDVLERVLLENDGRIARAVVAAGSSDWLYSVLKTEGGALEAFPFGLWHVAVMGCRVAPDTRKDVRMQQRALFEDRPAWERALEMRVRARAKLVPDRVKGVLANVATRARLAALGTLLRAVRAKGIAEVASVLPLWEATHLQLVDLLAAQRLRRRPHVRDVLPRQQALGRRQLLARRPRVRHRRPPRAPEATAPRASHSSPGLPHASDDAGRTGAEL